MCAGLWWEDVLFVELIDPELRIGYRIMPAFGYRCAIPPNGTVKHEPAIVASFPIGRLVIVDPELQHLEKVNKLNDLNSDIKLSRVDL